MWRFSALTLADLRITNPKFAYLIKELANDNYDLPFIVDFQLQHSSIYLQILSIIVCKHHSKKFSSYDILEFSS